MWCDQEGRSWLPYHIPKIHGEPVLHMWARCLISRTMSPNKMQNILLTHMTSVESLAEGLAPSDHAAASLLQLKWKWLKAHQGTHGSQIMWHPKKCEILYPSCTLTEAVHKQTVQSQNYWLYWRCGTSVCGASKCMRRSNIILAAIDYQQQLTIYSYFFNPWSGMSWQLRTNQNGWFATTNGFQANL